LFLSSPECSAQSLGRRRWLYWSGTEYAPSSDGAWDFYARYGYQHRQGKGFQYCGWAVRPGQVDVAALDVQPVSTPGTLLLIGAGLLGLSVGRRRLVLRRFV